MSTHVKTCGLSTDETVSAAIDAGARYVGFVLTICCIVWRGFSHIENQGLNSGVSKSSTTTSEHKGKQLPLNYILLMIVM